GVVPNHRVPLFDLPLPHLVDALLVGSRRCRITPTAHWEGSRTVTVPHCRHSIHVPLNTPPSTSMSVRSWKVFPQRGHSAMTVPPLRRSRGPNIRRTLSRSPGSTEPTGTHPTTRRTG